MKNTILTSTGLSAWYVIAAFLAMSYSASMGAQVNTSPPDLPADTAHETILDNLNNPTAVAIQPETNAVFVADSGALRVIRVVDGTAEPVITGFAKGSFGKSPIYDIGPLSLLFLDRDTLVVGTGGLKNGEDHLAVYKIPASGSEPIDAEQFIGDVQTLPSTADVEGEGDFFGLAKIDSHIYATCHGDDEKVWIGMASVSDGKLEKFERLIALKEKTRTTAPTAITISPEQYLAIAQMGTIDQPADSVLTFCDPVDNQVVATFKTGLNDISGLAYGPKRGRLFATEFNWADKFSGGLFKLIAAGDGCRSQLLLKLRKPTALAFAPNGDLYLTLAGDTSEGAPHPNGKLIRVTGLDEDPNQQGSTDSKE